MTLQSHLLKEGILEMEVPDIPDKDKIVTLQVSEVGDTA